MDKRDNIHSKSEVGNVRGRCAFRKMSEENLVKKLEKDVEHWKNLASQYKRNFESVQEELEEFQGESKELEKELEAQLEQAEKKNRDLTGFNQKLLMENDGYKTKVQLMQLENCAQVDRLEAELAKVTNERDELTRYIRDLEQTNDDLERAKRAAISSLEDFEKRLNDAIERNAFLENELDEKDALQVYVQRLKEETRDLKQELQVKDRLTETDNKVPPMHRPASVRTSSLANGSVPAEAQSPQESRKTSIDNHAARSMLYDVVTQSASIDGTVVYSPHNGMLTPSTRISALNIVGDLLRKVGALESKLASCRRFSMDQSYPETPTSPTKTIANTSAAKPSIESKVAT